MQCSSGPASFFLLTFAKAGEEIIIRDRSLPVAKLVPFSGEEASDEELLLVAAGKMRLPTGPLDIDELLSIPAIQALLDERTRDCEQRALVLGLERLGAAVRR